MVENCIFAGRALCSVDDANPQFRNDMRGAYVPIVCSAADIAAAVEAIRKELSESALTLRGFDYLFDVHYLDRKPSIYEDQLIARLESYPVQFENVHYFKSDG